MEIHICNTSEAPRKAKARNIAFYLDDLKQRFELELDKLVVTCTDGDIKPPFPYQWQATTKHRVGDDDPFEGVGESPLEAIHDLWKNVKSAIELADEEDSNP